MTRLSSASQEATAFEDYFAPVKLTPHAIDRASQIVPEEHWKGLGIYSWLEGRANLAFKHMPISSKEFTMRKLRYTFEYTSEGHPAQDGDFGWH